MAAITTHNQGELDVLDDPSIAPPPDAPIPKDYTQSMFHMEEDFNKDAMPSFGNIKHSGFCLARISTRALLMKRWKKVFWIAYGDETLLFFKTKEMFEDWVMDPYLSSRQRETLVKLRVDFGNVDRSDGETTSAEEIKGYITSPLKTKQYSYGGAVIHQFKLDKWIDGGPSIAAAFGSENVAEVRQLHMIMSEMIKISPSSSLLAELGYSSDADSKGSYYSGGQSVSAWDDESSAGGSIYSTKSTRSGVSVGSNGSRGKYVLGNIRAAITAAHDKMEGGMERRR